MKKIMIAIFCAVVLVFAVASAKANTINLSIGDAYYVGSIVAGIPPSNQNAYLQYLLSMTPGTGPVDYDGQSYTRTNLDGSLPTYSSLTDNGKVDVPDGSGAITITVGSIVYVMGKYDQDKAGTAVWYVGGLQTTDEFAIPMYWGKYGLSNYHTWSGTPVPEPTTLLLLGFGLVGLAGAGRKFKK